MTGYDDFVSKLKATAGAVGDTVGKAAGSAAKKTGELAELARLNMNLYSLRGEQEKELATVGGIFYAASKGETLDEEKLAVLYTSLDARKAKMDEIEEKVSRLKSNKTCKACGASFAKEYAYCPVCGEKAE